MRKMRFKLWFPLLLIATVGLTACGSDDDNDPTGEIRVIHASADAPEVNINLTDTASNRTETPVTNLDYAESSGFNRIDARTYDVDVEAITPTGNSTVISVPGVKVEEDSRTTVVAVGTVDSDDAAALEAVVLPDPSVDPTASQVSLSVLHASPEAGSVDVYVTAPGTDVDTVSPTFTFDYKDVVDASAAVGPLPAGNYQIQVTAPGTSTVLYDSGNVDLSPFAGTRVALLAVDTVNQTTQDAAPIKLLAVTDSSVVELLDTDTQAGVKVAHVAPDAGAVDVVVDGSVAVSSLDYLDVAATDTGSGDQSYIGLDAGSHELNVNAPAGSGTAVFSTPVAADLAAGMEYSVLALGKVSGSGDTAFDLSPTTDANRAIATQASVKVVHGAPDVGTVDVYVTTAGDVSVADITGGSAGNPAVADLDFRTITDYLALDPGDYDIRVLDQASNTVVIDATGVTLSGGDVITAIARQADGVDGDPAEPGLLLLTN
jgi:hypothetical protein